MHYEREGELMVDDLLVLGLRSREGSDCLLADMRWRVHTCVLGVRVHACVQCLL